MRGALLILFLVLILPFSTSCSESVHTKSLPKATANILNEIFFMPTVMEVVKKGQDQEGAKKYFNKKTNRYKRVATQSQGEMIVDGYSVLDINSSIIGYSLFFHKSSGSLAIVDASVNPLNSTALEVVSKLIAKSFDSVKAGEKSKLYFLGILDIGNQQVLKIMIREAHSLQAKEYAIRYAVSQK